MRSRGWTGWADLIPPERWSVYQRFLQNAILRRITFALGGACATATHTGCWRDTNDMDIYMSTALSDHIVGRVEATTGLEMNTAATVYVDLRKVHFFEPGATGMNLSLVATEPAHAVA